MDTLTQDQINAMVGMSHATPDQHAQALSHSNGMLGTILSTGGAIAGGIGGAALGGLAGIETGPGALATGYLGGVAGSGAGAAAGEALAQKLEGQPTDTGDIAKTGAMAAGTEAVLGPVGSMIAKPLSKVASPIISGIGKGLGYVAEKFGGKPAAEQIGKAVEETVTKRPINVATKRLQSTADTMTKGEIEKEASRVTPSGKLMPSKTEQRAGEIMKGKTFANPTKTYSSLKNEISTRGQKIEQYLGENGRPISNEEDYQMFAEARDKASKYLTPSQLAGYDHAIEQFQNELRGMGNMNTGTYYKALKNFEQNVTENLPKGKEALLSDTGSGQIVGAKTVRGVVRDMIGTKHKNFANEMYDLASLYDAKDNVQTQIANLAKKSTTFAKRHPVITKGAKAAGLGAAGAVGAGGVYETGKSLLGE